jgi:hypothetical protein
MRGFHRLIGSNDPNRAKYGSRHYQCGGSQLTNCRLLTDKAASPKSYGGYQMTNESSDAVKIRRVPNGKFYVWGNGEAICLTNGSLRYFQTHCDRLGVSDPCRQAGNRQDRRIAEFTRHRVETALRRRQWLLPDAASADPFKGNPRPFPRHSAGRNDECPERFFILFSAIHTTRV